MKALLACLLTCTFLLIGCKEKIQADDQAAPAAQSAQQAPDAPAEKSTARREVGPTTPERIAEIGAMGRTGLWSEVTEVCRGDHPRTWLLWNVRDSGAARVVVYVVDQHGDEKHFGQGGPVGEKVTGPWLRPGIEFKIRAMDDGRELGSVKVGEKAC